MWETLHLLDSSMRQLKKNSAFNDQDTFYPPARQQPQFTAEVGNCQAVGATPQSKGPFMTPHTVQISATQSTVCRPGKSASLGAFWNANSRPHPEIYWLGLWRWTQEYVFQQALQVVFLNAMVWWAPSNYSICMLRSPQVDWQTKYCVKQLPICFLYHLNICTNSVFYTLIFLFL